ncbi:serine hydrolase [Patescibacteria group bacterium]|nr:serine hydrolase [Patescibacteria group bacterium]
MKRSVYIPLVIFLVAFVLACVFRDQMYYESAKNDAAVFTALFEEGEMGLRESVSADAWLVFDTATGESIVSTDENKVLPLASVTKLMTAHVAFRTYDLKERVVVSEKAVSTEGSSGRMVAGESMSVRDLLFPLLLESSNDAAEAVAESASRSLFIGRMNAEAERLGMKDTVFVDPSGIDAGNITTARDIASLLTYIFVHERYLLDITTLTQYVGERIGWLNNNPVVGVEGYQGGKHGYTDEAGRTFAGLFIQKFKDSPARSVGIVLLGSDQIVRDTEILRTFIETSVSYTARETL